MMTLYSFHTNLWFEKNMYISKFQKFICKIKDRKIAIDNSMH